MTAPLQKISQTPVKSKRHGNQSHVEKTQKGGPLQGRLPHYFTTGFDTSQVGFSWVLRGGAAVISRVKQPHL